MYKFRKALKVVVGVVSLVVSICGVFGTGADLIEQVRE